MPSSPFDLPDDPSHPVIYALSRACTENWEAFSDTVTKLSAQAARPPGERLCEADAVRIVESALSHIRKVAEIIGWIFYGKAMRAEEAFQRAQTFRELGDDWVENLASRLQKLPQGRPPTRRQSHIEAFEYMLQSKKNSLGKAVRKFCPCEKDHGTECRTKLKSGIHSLKKMLCKYAPELVVQYDALHPDRAKKSHGMVNKSAGFSPHQR